METKDFARLWSQGKSSRVSCQSFWDNRADEFNRTTTKGHTNERIGKIVEYLSFHNLLTKNSSVLDIGCGPGKFAVEFAKRSKEVMGIDISVKMLDYAVNNAETADLTNVSFKNANWDEVDLKEYGWKKKFDLVTAINSPGIHDPLTLKKMIDASKRYCFLSNFVDRHDSVQDVLRTEVLNLNEKRFYSNTIYSIFNILWLQGYYPSITYIDTDQEHTRTLDEACSYYGILMETEKEPAKIALIRNYLQEIAIKGLITERVQTKSAWLYWEV